YAAPGSTEDWAARLASWVCPPLARRMQLRYNPELAVGRVIRNPWLVLPEQIARAVSPNPEEYYCRASKIVGRWVQDAGWGQSNVLMGFIRNIEPRLCRLARHRGLLVVGDQIIAPAAVEHREAAIQRE